MATTKITPAPLTRPIREVAAEIIKDHRDADRDIPFGAVPYLDAMRSLDTMDDWFYDDDADSVVLYALSNLSTWRGETARRVKAELKAARAHHAIAIHAPTD